MPDSAAGIQRRTIETLRRPFGFTNCCGGDKHRSEGLPLGKERSQEGGVRRQIKTILFAAGCLSLTSAAAAQERAVAPGQFVDWTQKDGSMTIAVAGTSATIEVAPCDKGGDVGEDCYRAKVSVTVAGKGPVRLMGEPGIAYRIAIGRLDAADTGASVMLDSFTGGAHCCHVYSIAEPIGDAVRIVPVTWRPAGSYLNDAQTMFDVGDIPFPTDLSGDGHADIVLRDDRFLYQFESYAGSLAPPIVLSLSDGGTGDSSTDPRFLPLFAEAMARAEAICTNRSAFGRNGACGAYVADAARLGRMDEAWGVMERHYDRRSSWPLGRCTADYVDGKCPAGHDETFPNFPAALRSFLQQTGYTDR